MLRILPAPGNPQKVTFKPTPHFATPKLTQGDPQVSIVELWAPKMTPKWSPKSTLFATGRQSKNSAPAAARTLLSALGQTPKSMKKQFWFRAPARTLLFRLLKSASTKREASSPQNELQSDPKVTPDVVKNRYFWPAWGTWRANVAVPWPKRHPWHQKVTQIHHQITKT